MEKNSCAFCGHGAVGCCFGKKILVLGAGDIEGTGNQIAFNPAQGEMLASTGNTYTELWDTTTGQRLQTIKPLKHECLDPDCVDWPTLVAFSPDGQQLALGYTGEGIEIWNLANGESQLFQTDPNDLAFSPTDSRLLASGDFAGYVSLWDTSGGHADAPLQTLKGQRREESMESVAFTADGRYIVAASHKDSEQRGQIGDQGVVYVWGIQP